MHVHVRHPVQTGGPVQHAGLPGQPPAQRPPQQLPGSRVVPPHDGLTGVHSLLSNECPVQVQSVSYQIVRVSIIGGILVRKERKLPDFQCSGIQECRHGHEQNPAITFRSEDGARLGVGLRIFVIALSQHVVCTSGYMFYVPHGAPESCSCHHASPFPETPIAKIKCNSARALSSAIS